MTSIHGADRVSAPTLDRLYHRSIMLGLMSSVVLLHQLTGDLDLAAMPLAAAGLIIVFGLPHGALDVVVAGMHRNFRSRRILIVFLIQYLAVASFVTVMWWLVPAFALVAFLIISAIHFGGDWDDTSGRLGQGLIGVAMLSGTTLVYSSQVADIFSWLVPQASAISVAEGLRLIAPFAVAAAAVALMSAARRSPLGASEAAATVGCAVLLPPITFFVVYFCLLHSVRHLCETRAALWQHSSQDLIRAAAPYALVAAFLCLAGSLAFVQLGPGEALLSSVFVVLSALTVPHMLLVEWARPCSKRSK